MNEENKAIISLNEYNNLLTVNKFVKDKYNKHCLLLSSGSFQTLTIHKSNEILEKISLENEQLQKIIQDNRRYLKELEQKLEQYECIPKWIINLFI